MQKYKVLSVVSHTSKTVIYQALRQSDQLPVILKTLTSDYPSTADIAQLKHEYNLACDLNLSSVVRIYALDEFQGKPILVLEDFGGKDLIYWLQEGSLSITQVLWIGQHLAQTLGQIHERHIIHKDIKPENIVFEPETQQLKIIDFSIASRLSKENPKISSPNLLEGTLAYMSPEQTGRMNRFIDYRTDFYSLGITLYQLLTGQLPFESNDPMELVHCHIAKAPRAPHEINPKLPLPLSDIVLKLMAKTAEDRYQSAYGIKMDLEVCSTQWQMQQSIEPFTLAQDDRRGNFSIPQKLYGRENEVSQLLAAFDRVNTGTTELILVAGYSGIGKSALVNEVHKPITRQRGYFIRGKFDQFQRNIPYASPIQAFRELIRQLLTESEAQVKTWQAKLLVALGNNGQVIADVIPEIESIIGKQPDVQSLPPSESQNRFNLVFRAFIHVFTQKEHPLVIFLDDLQWADAGSLQLIQQLMTDPDGQYLLLLGAYRDNEVDSGHPLIRMLGEVTERGANPQTIILKPLDLIQIRRLVSDTLYLPESEINTLAQLLLQNTKGNPFFLAQLFKYLYTEGLIQFDLITGQWYWNSEDLYKVNITENVVDLMVHEIQKLDFETQNILQLAACVGNQFDLAMLAIVNEKSATATADDLWNALQASLVVPLSDDYKIPQVVEACEANQILYRFLHDRVQQAAYSLIPDTDKQQVHLKVGRLLFQSISSDQLDDRIFDVVNPMNIGAALIEDEAEQVLLAQLNYRAGCKAQAAAAYDSALEYFLIGRDLLPAEAWQTHYDLALNLYTSLVEANYLLTRFDDAQTLSEVVLTHARILLNRVKIYELKIQFFIAENQMQGAIETALPVLELLGYPLETDPDLLQLVAPLPTLGELADYPEMVDRTALAALEILMIITGPAYQSRPDLLPFIVFRMVNLCLTLGHSSLAAYAYGMYGLMLCGPLNQVELGYQSGQISLHILEQYPSDALKCKIHMLFNSFVGHWQEAHHLTIEALEKTVYWGLETGDMVYAAYCAMWSCGYMMLTGMPLAEVAVEQQLYVDLLAKTKQDHGWYPAITWRQLTETLQNSSPNVQGLEGNYLRRELVEHIHASANQMLLFFVYFAEVILSYVMKDWSTAKTKIELASQYQPAATASMLAGGYVFYEALVRLMVHTDLCEEAQSTNWHNLACHQEQLATWSKYSPQNYQSKYELVLAERSRLEGEVVIAMDYYDRAIATAQAYGFWAEVGMAAERAAEFYESLGRQKIAKQYWLDAIHAYDRWGAIAKVQALQTEYPLLQSLTTTVGLRRRSNRSTNKSSTARSNDPSLTQTVPITTAGGGILDFNTVIKAAQALSKEIVLSQLLNRLTSLALENAGAQVGYLLLKKEDQLVIVASGHSDDEVVAPSSLNLPLSSASPLPLSVIQYVQRSQEPVVLNHAAAEGLFVQDPHIMSQQTQSVLCVPILQQGQLLGILYLENNLAVGAFTNDRLEVLNILTTQAAISITNAQLYQNLENYSNNLEQMVEDRTQELQQKNQSLQKTLQELQQTQAQLIQAEKMSSLGQMVAGIAHEINNPISFILGNISHAQQYFDDLFDLVKLYEEVMPEPSLEIQNRLLEIELDFLREDLKNLFQSMNAGCNRINQIVLSLRNFSRLDEADQKCVDLHDGLDNTLLIVQHRLLIKSSKVPILVRKNYGLLPLVMCYASMLNQVFLNIFNNAIDALNSREETIDSSHPEICITTELVEVELADNKTHSVARIRISDNGMGMSQKVQKKAFDPFFTTKPVGQGKGLGLSVSFQIITEQHGGQLRCFSEPGEGTEFVIDLPIHQSR